MAQIHALTPEGRLPSQAVAHVGEMISDIADAYQVAVAEGFTGTREEWLASLVGPQGEEGPYGGTEVTDPQVASYVASATETRSALETRYRAGVTAREYGAVGNGSADDTDAIQGALDAVGNDGGGTVYLQPGTYRVTSPLTISQSGVHLEMGSARLLADHPHRVVTVSGTESSPLSDISVTGGLIDLASVAAHGVSISHATGPTVRTTVIDAPPSAYAGSAVSFGDCTEPVVHVRATTVGTGVSLVRSTGAEVTAVVRNSYRDGVNVYDSSHDATVRAVVLGYNTIGENGRAGVHVYGSNRVAVIGPRVDSGNVGGTDDSPKVRFRDARGCSISGGVLTGAGGGSGGISVIVLSDIGEGGGSVAISGVTILDVGSYGIQVAAGTGGDITEIDPIAVSGCVINGVSQYGASSGYAIHAGSSLNWSSITGNMISNCDGEGVLTSGQASITGNTIRNVGSGTLGSRCGIYIIGGESVVEGNTVVDDRATKLMNYGLRVYTGAIARMGANRFETGRGGTQWIQGSAQAEVAPANGVIGFFGKTPVSKPTGVTADASSIRNALVSLGLIS